MGFVLSRTEVEAMLPERRGSVLTPPDTGAGENLESDGVIDWPEAKEIVTKSIRKAFIANVFICRHGRCAIAHR